MPRAKRLRAVRNLTLEEIRESNPELDDEQGARAFLWPIGSLAGLLDDPAWTERGALHILDRAVDVLSGVDTDASHWERASPASVEACDLQLFTLDTSPEMLAAASFAGFFTFASEFRFPGRPLEHRGLLNLELGGPEVTRQDGDPGGRLVLDLSPGSADRLVIGKRSLKKALSTYTLTVNRVFERSWAAIVHAHGIDWCGFATVRAGFLALHQKARPPWSLPAGKLPPPNVVSIELWDGDELISAEVGILVGRCYTCLSLFSRADERSAEGEAKWSRADWIRAQSAVLWLRHAGIHLFMRSLHELLMHYVPSHSAAHRINIDNG